MIQVAGVVIGILGAWALFVIGFASGFYFGRYTHKSIKEIVDGE